MLNLDFTATIQRQQAVGTNGRHELADLSTGVACLALPMTPMSAISQGFTVGQAYDVFFEYGTDVRISDKLLVNDMSLTVKGVSPYLTVMNTHTHAQCVRENS